MKILFGVLFVFICASISFAEIVNPLSAPDTLLDRLAQELDSKGIDVRRGNSTSSSFSSSRPQLSNLKTLPSSGIPKIESLGRFGAHFEAGVFSDVHLIAVKKNARKSSAHLQSFREEWRSAPKTDRVFVSFSGKDISYAEDLKAALEKQGYRVFLYKTETSKHPITNSVEVGKYFKEAGRHLVIDSKNARSSVAVLMEAKTLRNMHSNRSPLFGIPGSSSGSSRDPGSGMPCCKLCTYRNRVLVSCGSVECGPQCLSASPGL